MKKYAALILALVCVLVKMNIEKGAWFKIGVSIQNESDIDKVVYVEVRGVDVRIE